MTNKKNDYLIKLQHQNGFLNPTDGEIVNGRYDEPTYLTFRVDFLSNKISSLSNKSLSFDNKIKNSPKEDLNYSLNELPAGLFDVDGAYSTYDYLKNRLGDEVRADLYKKFIKLVKDLNANFPYYIKTIEGIDKLFEVNVKRGTRVKKDAVLTLKCYEGLDQRISTLKTLYKKIAWDEEYQRWILPDIMRYFSMDIYISEFRIFHENKNKKYVNTLNGDFKKESKLSSINTIKNIVKDTTSMFSMPKNLEFNKYELSNNIINKVIPTTIINCKLCEFDIRNYYSHYSSLSKTDPKSKVVDDIDIKIKVGNVNEIIYNGTFKGEEDNEIFINDEYTNQEKFYKIKNYMDPIKKILSDNVYKGTIKNILFNKRTNIEVEEVNDGVAVNLTDDNNIIFSGYLGNMLKGAIKGAIAYGDNWLNDELNDYYSEGLNLKMKENKKNKFRKMVNGLTLNDIIAPIASGNINAIIDTFKNKANNVKDLYPELSKATNQNIDIETFKSFIEEMSKSEDEMQSKVAKCLLDYGEKTDASNIEDYMEIINTVNEDIQNNFIEKISSVTIEEPEEYSTATSQTNDNVKIIL